MRSLPLLVFSFISFVSVHAQAILHVPSDMYPTIQSALNAARTGNEILVQPGTYYENLVWKDVDGIRLVSAGDSSNTIIDGRGIARVLLVSGLNIDTSTVVKGFTLRNGANVSTGGGVYIRARGIVFDGVRITKNRLSADQMYPGQGGGIATEQAQWMDFANVILRNSSIVGNESGGILLQGRTRLHVVGCNIDSNTSYGIRSTSGSILTVQNTDVTSTRSVGIPTNGNGLNLSQTTVSLRSVRIVGNEGAGMLLSLSSFTGDNLTIAENGNGGVGSQWADGTLDSTTIVRNKVYGLNLENHPSGGSNVVITRSTFVDNTGAGAVTTTARTQISNSNFEGNGWAVSNVNDTYMLDAHQNWWGHPTGPYHALKNPNGKGDAVSTYVTITPFLTLPDPTAPPIPPRTFRGASATGSSITLEWRSASIPDLAGYRVYYTTDMTDMITYEDSTGLLTDTTFTLTGLEEGRTYYIAAATFDTDGNRSWYSSRVVMQSGTFVATEGETRGSSVLEQNFPNPYSGSTTIAYRVSAPSRVRIQVINLLGQVVRTVVDEQQDSGDHEVSVEMHGVPSGVYFYRMEVGDFVQTKRMVVVK